MSIKLADTHRARGTPKGPGMGCAAELVAHRYQAPAKCRARTTEVASQALGSVTYWLRSWLGPVWAGSYGPDAFASLCLSFPNCKWECGSTGPQGCVAFLAFQNVPEYQSLNTRAMGERVSPAGLRFQSLAVSPPLRTPDKPHSKTQAPKPPSHGVPAAPAVS